MPRPHPRLSHRHILALGTFLVPLAILAALGWMELRRSSELAQAALEREARQFLASARQAIEQQFELQLPSAFATAQRLLADDGPIRTALRLRDEDGFVAIEHLVLLDEQAGLVWPTLPTFGVSLPLARDPQQGEQNIMSSALAASELLLSRGDLKAAMERLEELIERLETANPTDPENSGRRPQLEETELHARFRLATALRKTGEIERASDQFRIVQRIAADRRNSRRIEADLPAFELVASAALAELGSDQERLDLLSKIAEDRFAAVADGLAGALANRLAARFPVDDPQRDRVDRLLREEGQRETTREFAASYELVLKYNLRSRLLRQSNGDDPTLTDERIIATLGDHASLFAIRPATPAEQERFLCSHVGINFDLDRLIGPALQAFVAVDGNFRLAVEDPDGVVLLPPPANVPEAFTVPMVETNNELRLRAYPADPARMIREAESATDKRTLLMIGVFITALGGALWSWRSVSREAELAALKIDLVSRVSHELKTPLALIRMYGETLGMGRVRDSSQAAEFGSIIARESERLTTLIQRILDFSRQQAGTLDYSAENHDLGESIRAVAYAYAPHLQAKGVFLIDDLPLDIHVRCDKNGLESAIINMLENTTKYGREGVDEHEVELVLRREGHNAVIEVLDRGRGIPDGEHTRVFEGFFRASNAGQVRGAGLGLGIVRHFARAHGGDIVALPRDGGGTIMRLTLPLTTDPVDAGRNELPIRPQANNQTRGHAS